jgi:hypothetical protein
MVSSAELLKQGRRDEFWQRYCGFFDLTVDEFMVIQERLLTEQLQLLAGSELGRKIVGGKVPQNVAEFRRVAPLTTYSDYLPYLAEKREDALPAKPICWARTSGRTGEYRGKWVPITPDFFNQLARGALQTIILAGARRKGEVILEEGASIMYAAGPPPYVTGWTMRAIEEQFPMRFIPPIAEAEKMSFQERLQKGFADSMGSGIDYFAGVASVLLRIGDAFTEGTRQMSLSPTVLRPTILARLLKALATSKLEGRKLLPKDIWRPKGISVSGMDVQVYRKRIQDLWGQSPLEAYGCTEFGGLAVQAWGDRTSGMTPSPEATFWEFLPEQEYALWRANRTYRAQTVLMNQVQPGKYVVVGTSLSGGAFVRYILGDLIRIVARRDEERGIDLPQMVVESRADDSINLGSMVELTERSIWQAIGHAELRVVDWTARKENILGQRSPVLHMYVEDRTHATDDLAALIHDGLIATNEEYASFNEIMGVNPPVVTPLTPGTFQAYMEAMQAEGADLGHLKPPRMQPSDQILNRLLSLSTTLRGTS